MKKFLTGMEPGVRVVERHHDLAQVSTLTAALAGVVALVGVAAGHLVRRGVPRWLGARHWSLPFRWPWIEAVAALAALTVAWRFPMPEAAGWFAFALLLLAIAACDYQAKLIPDVLTRAGVVLGAVWSVLSPERLFELPGQSTTAALVGLGSMPPRVAALALSLLGAVLGLLALEALRRGLGAVAGLEVMGFGDSKLAAALGAFLGPAGVVEALVLGFLFGVVHGVVASWVSGMPHSAFGPPLAAGGFAVALAGEAALPVLGAFQSALLSLPLAALVAIYTVLLGTVVVLMLRVRRRAARYEALIEDDYLRIDAQLDADPVSHAQDDPSDEL